MDFEIFWTLIGGDEHFANRKEAARQQDEGRRYASPFGHLERGCCITATSVIHVYNKTITGASPDNNPRTTQ